MNLKELHALAESLLQQGVDPLTPIVLPEYVPDCDPEKPEYNLGEVVDVHLVDTKYRPDATPKMVFAQHTKGAALIFDSCDALYDLQLATYDIDTKAMHRSAPIKGPDRVVLAPTLFGGHYVSRQKVTQQDLLDELRQRVNKGYMPSATREGFNSKPDYVRWLDLAVEGHDRAARNFGCTGYFQRTDDWGFSDPNDPIWAYIETCQFEYLVNLSNDAIKVRRSGDEAWTDWTDAALHLPEDKRELIEVIDNFL